MAIRSKQFRELVAVLVSVTSCIGLAQTQSSRSSDAIHGATPAVITPDAATNVTTTGGTSGQVPVFNGASTVVNSNIFTTATGVGFNKVPNSGIALDVLGKMVVRGPFDLGRVADATTSSGKVSNPLQFHASALNSSNVEEAPFFQLQAEPSGNGTASPGATFNLLYNATGVTTASETGLSINPNGTINFAPGQTFSAGTGAPMCIATNGGFGNGGTTFIGPSFTVPAAGGCTPWSGFTKTASTVILTTSGAACLSSDGLKLTLSVSSADPDFLGAGTQASDYIQVTRASLTASFTNGGTDQGEFSGGAEQVSCTPSLLSLPNIHD